MKTDFMKIVMKKVIKIKERQSYPQNTFHSKISFQIDYKVDMCWLFLICAMVVHN